MRRRTWAGWVVVACVACSEEAPAPRCTPAANWLWRSSVPLDATFVATMALVDASDETLRLPPEIAGPRRVRWEVQEDVLIARTVTEVPRMGEVFAAFRITTHGDMCRSLGAFGPWHAQPAFQVDWSRVISEVPIVTDRSSDPVTSTAIPNSPAPVSPYAAIITCVDRPCADLTGMNRPVTSITMFGNYRLTLAGGSYGRTYVRVNFQRE